MDGFEDIKGYEKLYAINKEGCVYSHITHKELKPVMSNKYYVVCLTKNKQPKNYYIHKLLSLQFIPNPNGLQDIDHINQNKLDNRLENLRWVTSRQNANNRTNKSIHPLIWFSPYKKYQVHFRVNKKMCHFGCYKTLDEALSERDCQLDLHGLPNYCYD